MSYVTRNFGTVRGLVRLGVAWGEVALGMDGSKPAQVDHVQRLVFVCHGNICRSAFAEAVAHAEGLRAASFGLSTDSGKEAHAPASEAARRLGYDLSAHRTTRVEDFEPQPGDVLLGMECRHLRKLAGNAALADLPRMLLGRFATPPVPHLHDPYKLDPDYMTICLERTASAVRALKTVFPGARL